MSDKMRWDSEQTQRSIPLWGCNTLATKDGEHRTPEQYLRDLVRHGFSRGQAAQIVAFRFSILGDSFRKRMTQVFRSTPRIYGFSAAAPRGNVIAPYLESYLKSAKNRYADFDRYIEHEGTSHNMELMAALNSTAIFQTHGDLFNLEKTSNEHFIEENRPYCYLTNDHLSRAKKLEYVQEVLTSGQVLSVFPHIQNFFENEVSYNRQSLSTEETGILQSLASNQLVQDNFSRLLRLKGDIYVSIRVTVLKLMRDLKMIDEHSYSSSVKRFLKFDFSRQVTPELKDQICSLGVTTNLEVTEIPEWQWRDHSFRELMICLGSQNKKFYQKLFTFYLNLNDSIYSDSLLSDQLRLLYYKTLHERVFHSYLVDDGQRCNRGVAKEGLIDDLDTIDKIINKEGDAIAFLQYADLRNPEILKRFKQILENAGPYSARLVGYVAIAFTNFFYNSEDGHNEMWYLIDKIERSRFDKVQSSLAHEFSAWSCLAPNALLVKSAQVAKKHLAANVRLSLFLSLDGTQSMDAFQILAETLVEEQSSWAATQLARVLTSINRIDPSIIRFLQNHLEQAKEREAVEEVLQTFSRRNMYAFLGAKLFN